MDKNSNIVFSTNPEYGKESDNKTKETLLPGRQNLRVWLQRLGGGRVVTIIRGFEGSDGDLKQLGKMLKTVCSSGGTVKNGEILVQGDFREKIMNILKNKGYNTKYSGG